MTHTRMRSFVIAVNAGYKEPIELSCAIKNLAITPEQALKDINKCVADGGLEIIKHHGATCLIAV